MLLLQQRCRWRHDIPVFIFLSRCIFCCVSKITSYQCPSMSNGMILYGSKCLKFKSVKGNWKILGSERIANFQSDALTDQMILMLAITTMNGSTIIIFGNFLSCCTKCVTTKERMNCSFWWLYSVIIIGLYKNINANVCVCKLTKSWEPEQWDSWMFMHVYGCMWSYVYVCVCVLNSLLLFICYFVECRLFRDSTAKDVNVNVSHLYTYGDWWCSGIGHWTLGTYHIIMELTIFSTLSQNWTRQINWIRWSWIVLNSSRDS